MARLLTTLLLAGAVAASPSPAWAEEVEEVEVEEVEQVKVEEGQSAQDAPRGLTDSLGRFHPLVVHFPIAWLVLLLLVDCGGVGLRRQHLAHVGKWLLALTTLSLLPAAVTGLLRAESSRLPEAEVARVLLHRNMAFVTLGLVALALVLRLARRNDLAGVWRPLYLVLLLGAVGMVFVTGHLGGILVFGENYLPF